MQLGQPPRSFFSDGREAHDKNKTTVVIEKAKINGIS